MKTVGIIGLGIIGGIWARHYASAGMLKGVWNRTPRPDFPEWKPTAREVARAADVVQVVVADPAAVRGVVEAILPALGPGKIVVQSSTIDPASSDEFQQRVTATGARYLEAPFTGSKPAAEAKKTVFFLGGDTALVQELEPVLACVSAERFHVGTPRQAASLKLALNLNIAAQMEGLCEALSMARTAGIEDALFFRVLGSNVAYSGLVKLKEEKLRAADFSPQFSVKHMLKDMRLARELAGAGKLPALEMVRARLEEADRAGLSDADFSALMKLLEH